MSLDPFVIKNKVDEAITSAWKIIGDKALEANIEDGTKNMWLFYNRVASTLYARVNGVVMNSVAKELNKTEGE